jgi:anti-sigma regulatory factor (Ser/Thr protein kinase)
MRLVFDLVPGTAAPSQARTLAKRLAADVCPDMLADLRVVISELVANAVKYGPGHPIRVELDVVAPGHVRGHVADQGDGGDPAEVPHMLERPGAHGGYGLRLVAGLTNDWGVRMDGSDVWFELGG